MLVVVVVVVVGVVVAVVVVVVVVLVATAVATAVVVVVVVVVVDMESPSNHQKVAQNPQFLTLLTWKCASRHNGVHFFDIEWPSESSKSGPNPTCFDTFYFEMCFAPQRRALFRDRNVQKWSVPQVFCHFLLRNVLRATTACTFSTLHRPKVVRS